MDTAPFNLALAYEGEQKKGFRARKKEGDGRARI